MNYRILIVAAFSIAMGGCGWFGSSENIQPPAKLTPVEKQLQVEELWSVDAGAGSGEQAFRFVPAIGGGRVFVADAKGSIQALALTTGDRDWRVDTNAPLSSGPGYGGGLLAAGTADGRVLAYKADSGEPAWEAQVPSEVLAAPRVGNGIVAVRTIDGSLTALDASTGKRRWIFHRDTPSLTLRGTSAPVITEDNVVAGFDDGRLVAVSIEDGRAVWERDVAVASGRSELERMVDIDADPVVTEQLIYAATYQGRIAAVTRDDGRPVWSQEMSVYAGLDAGERRVFVTDANSHVWALDRRSGASFWKQDKFTRRDLTAPVLASDYVVVADLEGYLHWLSAEDGHIVTRHKVGSAPILVAPSAAGWFLVVLDSSGRVVALRTKRAAQAAP